MGVQKLFSHFFGFNPHHSSNQTISKQISTSTCQTDAPSGSDSPSKNPYSFNISSLIPGTLSKPEIARKLAKSNPVIKPAGQKPVPSNEDEINLLIRIKVVGNFSF